MLSWRVELLPFLGYEELYNHFDQNAAWNSPQNKRLLEYIPPEFQSAERFDDRTNYLLSVGEYIIPADVVATKGREFFDKLVSRYHMPASQQRQAIGG